MAISAQELRIGNKITHATADLKGGIQHDIITVDGNIIKSLELHPYLGYNPIPITSELLIACGFQESKHEMAGMGHRILIMKSAKRYLSIYKNLAIIEGEGESAILNYIYFIHQLQNLFFALANKELTYNPSTPITI